MYSIDNQYINNQIVECFTWSLREELSIAKDVKSSHLINTEDFVIQTVELGLAPLLEAIAAGVLSCFTEGVSQLFPEEYVRSSAKGLIFEITRVLESRQVLGTSAESFVKKGKGVASKKSATPLSISPRQRLLNTMATTQNPILQKNVFLGVLFLTGRSIDLSR